MELIYAEMVASGEYDPDAPLCVECEESLAMPGNTYCKHCAEAALEMSRGQYDPILNGTATVCQVCVARGACTTSSGEDACAFCSHRED